MRTHGLDKVGTKELFKQCLQQHGGKKEQFLKKHSLTKGDTVLEENHLETEGIVEALLMRICEKGDTPEKHHKIDYDAFLQIQLDLLKEIVKTEKNIRKRKKEDNSSEDLQIINYLKEHRRILKLLGSSVAWILLEFNRPYILTMAMGQGPGFIASKKGLLAELSCLTEYHNSKNERTAILHDITQCMRVGDLTIIDHGEVYPIEVKLATKRKRFDRRTIRQKRKMKTLKEWYHDGKSDKILSGYTAIRQTISKRDEHNWKEITNVLNKAEKMGILFNLLKIA